jgi:hypothetical protein
LPLRYLGKPVLKFFRLLCRNVRRYCAYDDGSRFAVAASKAKFANWIGVASVDMLHLFPRPAL